MSYSQLYESDKPQKKSDFKWPEGKKMGLSLTFDDARLTQTDKGIPVLNKYNVRATFYVSFDNLILREDAWKSAISHGHEIGNHSLYHACSGNFMFSRETALEDYSLERMRFELDSANKFIENTLGVAAVSFGYPCGQTFVGRGENTQSYVPVIASMFQTGRLWRSEAPNDPAYCDMAQLTGMEMDGLSFEQVKEMIESAKKDGSWLILAGHEMNETSGNLTSLLATLEAICIYANDPANDIWIDNVKNIADYINKNRTAK